jgi:uncharacterized protein YbjQ (UPF0145 family)
MILTTTPNIEGKKVVRYLGIVTAEVIESANVSKEIAASITALAGGRVKAYEEIFIKAREEALSEMAERAERLGANAIVGINLDYEVLGQSCSILLVSASGTAVFVEDI